MIEGVVNAAYKPVVTLSVIGPGGESREVDFFVDIGFTAYLVLPSAVVADLGLTSHDIGHGRLADGSVKEFPVYDVMVDWIGGVIYVEAFATGNSPLLGLSMMAGHYLGVDVRPGGRVLIQT